MNKGKIVTIAFILLVVLLGVLSTISNSKGAVLAPDGAVLAPDWNSLNQVIQGEGNRAYFRWSPQTGVYCTAVTKIRTCGWEWDFEDYWVEMETWATLACDTSPQPEMNDLWYKIGEPQVVGTWSLDWRTHGGGQVLPGVTLLQPCKVQILANGLSDKRNQWQNWQPITRSNPYP